MRDDARGLRIAQHPVGVAQRSPDESAHETTYDRVYEHCADHGQCNSAQEGEAKFLTHE
jgi:hypothetical protein